MANLKETVLSTTNDELRMVSVQTLYVAQKIMRQEHVFRQFCTSSQPWYTTQAVRFEFHTKPRRNIRWKRCRSVGGRGYFRRGGSEYVSPKVVDMALSSRVRQHQHTRD